MRPSQDPLLDIPDALDVLLSAISATTSSSSTLASSSTPASATRLLPVKLAASTNTSPEADSFGFIEHLVEALAALGRLGWALETLTQRQSAEVFALVEATVAEVEERAADRRRQNLAPTGAAMAMAPPPPSSTAISSSATVAGGSTLGSMATGIGVSGEAAAAAIGDATVLVGALHALDYSSSVDERAETLRDLFWTTYAKLDAVLQGLRVTWEVAGWIAGRKDFRDAPPSITTGGAPSAVASAPISASSTMQHKASGGGSAVAIAADVVEIWKPIQAEVRTLLRDYLTSEDSSLASTRNPIASVNDVLRDGKTQRDRTKNVFRFVDSDAKVNARLVKMYDEDLLRSLRSSVPGLVGLDTASTAVSVDDRLSLAATSPAAATTTQHRTVVPPDAFNVPILFQPTLAFLARASAVMPIGFNEDETSGLDEFVVKVYLPRLEEKVSDLFGQATRGRFETFTPVRPASNLPFFSSLQPQMPSKRTLRGER
jgi:exocyst complex component 4